MDILFWMRVITGLLFAAAIPPGIYLLAVYRSDSEKIKAGLKPLNFVLTISGMVGIFALIFSVATMILLITQHNVGAFEHNIRNIILGIFFNAQSWGLLYVTRKSNN